MSTNAMSTYTNKNGGNKASNNNNYNASGSGSNNNNKGKLRMTILSAYDLPDREPPLYIQLDITTASGKTIQVHTGPPVQRHKDRNSFKFHSHKANITSNGVLVVETASLSELYQATAVLTVVYASAGGTGSSTSRPPRYSAVYPLHQLLIHETTWLILNLQTPAEQRKQQQQQQAAETTTESGPEQTGTRPTPSAVTTPRHQQQTSTVSATTPQLIGSSSSASMDEMEDVPPTLRLQMTLQGPYRTEVAAMVNFVRAWLALVEDAEHKFVQHICPYLPSIQLQWLLIPTAPIVALAVVSTPILVGLTIVTLPLVLPVFLVCSVLATIGLAVAAGLYASTTVGRAQVAAWTSPLQHALLHTQTGQAWVYQTGPRPTPVNLCRTLFPTGIWGKLLLSLWIDFMGSATYLLPILGEALDVFWAPLQTTFIMALYCPPTLPASSLENDTMATTMGSMGFTALPYMSFVEEILPLTDIVPTATLGWFGEFAWPFLVEHLFAGLDVMDFNIGADGNKAPRGTSGTSIRDALVAHQQ